MRYATYTVLFVSGRQIIAGVECCLDVRGKAFSCLLPFLKTNMLVGYFMRETCSLRSWVCHRRKILSSKTGLGRNINKVMIQMIPACGTIQQTVLYLISDSLSVRSPWYDTEVRNQHNGTVSSVPLKIKRLGVAMN